MTRGLKTSPAVSRSKVAGVTPSAIARGRRLWTKAVNAASADGIAASPVAAWGVSGGNAVGVAVAVVDVGVDGAVVDRGMVGSEGWAPAVVGAVAAPGGCCASSGADTVDSNN